MIPADFQPGFFHRHGDPARRAMAARVPGLGRPLISWSSFRSRSILSSRSRKRRS